MYPYTFLFTFKVIFITLKSEISVKVNKFKLTSPSKLKFVMVKDEDSASVMNEKAGNLYLAISEILKWLINWQFTREKSTFFDAWNKLY